MPSIKLSQASPLNSNSNNGGEAPSDPVSSSYGEVSFPLRGPYTSTPKPMEVDPDYTLFTDPKYARTARELGLQYDTSPGKLSSPMKNM